MKFKFIVSALILFSIQAYSQTKNNLSVAYGTTDSYVNIYGAIGSFGYHTKRANTFGLNYSRQLTKVLTLQTGLYYAKNDVEENSIYSGYSTTSYGTIKLITVPILAKISFLKYLYADAGFTADIQTDYGAASIAPKQSGIGFEAGVGAQYTFNSVTIFVSPYFQQHAIIKFDDGQNFSLFNGGFKFGIGYNF